MVEHTTEGFDPIDEVSRVRAVITALHLTMKTAGSHGPQHPLTLQAGAETAQAVVAARPPLAIQFIGQATFCDRSLIPLDIQGFHLSQQLARALHVLDLHEIEFEPGFDARGALALAELLNCPTTQRAGAIWDEIPHLHLSSLPGARTGLDKVDVDVEVLAATHVSLAVAAADSLAAEPADTPWNWRTGMAIVRRLDRAAAATAAGAQCALELVPGAWSPARRAVSSVLHVLLALADIGASSAAARGAAHAALALTVRGLTRRDGLTVGEAATKLLPALLQRPATQGGTVEPHIIRVCSIVNLLSPESGEETVNDPILQLVALCYDLELRRSPQGTNIDLSFLDVLAWAMRIPVTYGPWPALLARAAGLVPPGSRVRLADGAIGIVLEADAADPLRPTVLVGGQVRRALHPVTLLSATTLGGR